MKRIAFSTISAAAVSLSLLAAPAFAQGFNDAAAAGLAKLGIQAPPVESMTNEQVAAITNVLNSSDTDAVKTAHIKNILGNEATMTGNLGVAQLRDSAAADMAALGMDAEVVDGLTLSQLGQIELVMSGSDPDDIKRARVEEIIGNEAVATGRLGVAQLQDSAAADLAALGLDAEVVETLTISQLGQIENVMSSSDTDDQKRERVQMIVAE